MVNQCAARVVLMFVGLFVFLAALTVNSLSGFGAKSGECLLDKSAEGFVKCDIKT